MLTQKIQAQILQLPNPGYMVVDLPADIMQEINLKVDHVIANPDQYPPKNPDLAGHIKQEYGLDLPSTVTDNIVECCRTYCQRVFGDTRTPRLEDLWINLQRRTEYNPIHNHDGHISFVIWVRIPYDLEAERQVCRDSRSKSASMFGFVYSDVFGKLDAEYLAIDKSWEGRMAIFPANLNHMVHPFYTSDGIRVSISGNLYLDDNSK